MLCENKFYFNIWHGDVHVSGWIVYLPSMCSTCKTWFYDSKPVYLQGQGNKLVPLFLLHRSSHTWFYWSKFEFSIDSLNNSCDGCITDWGEWGYTLFKSVGCRETCLKNGGGEVKFNTMDLQDRKSTEMFRHPNLCVTKLGVEIAKLVQQQVIEKIPNYNYIVKNTWQFPKYIQDSKYGVYERVTDGWGRGEQEVC